MNLLARRKNKVWATIVHEQLHRAFRCERALPRAKRHAILSDLAARGLTLEECPHIAISLRFIDEAIARLTRRTFKPRF